MENFEPQLVDDVWFSILNYLPLHVKLLVAQVSKNWLAISRHPVMWTKLEVSMAGKFSNINAKSRAIEIFFNFVTKYCTELTDLYFNAGFSKLYTEEFQSLLAKIPDYFDELFQIKTLRRVTLVDFSYVTYQPKKTPLCQDLRLLNVADIITDDTFGEFIQELPNLEELYLSSRADYGNQLTEALKRAQQLQILALPVGPLHLSNFELASPSLKYVVLYSPASAIPDYIRTKFPKALVFSDQAFGPDIFNVVNELPMMAPLLSQYYRTEGSTRVVLSYLLTKYHIFQAAIEYLIKELHFDPNLSPDMPHYRPSFYRGIPFVDAEYPLEAAIIGRRQKLGAVGYLLNSGAKAEHPLPNRSFLVRCLASPEVFSLMLQHGADPNKIVDGHPLYVKAFKARTQAAVIDAMIEKKMDIDYQTEEGSLLDLAIKASSREAIEILIDAGAKISLRTVKLLLAYDMDQVKELLKRQMLTADMFDVESAATALLSDFALDSMEAILKHNKDKTDNSGMTVLHYISASFDEYKGNNVEKSTKSQRRWHVVSKTPVNSDHSTQSNAKPFSFDFSAPFGTPEPTFQLKSFTSGPFNPFDPTPITDRPVPFEAVPTETPPQTSDTKEAQLFENRIKVIFDDVNARNLAGETPLLLVTKTQTEESQQQPRVDCLLERGADVNLSDKNGWTPLHAAYYSGHYELAKTLLRHQANLNAQDQHSGVTPLMAAVYGLTHNNILDHAASDTIDNLFIGLGTDNILMDFSLAEKYTKRTLLHLLVCVMSDVKALDTVLTNNKHDINARDSDGFTPLHYAVMFGKFELISVLQKHGADFNAQTYGMRLTPAMLLLHITTTASPYLACLEQSNLMLQGSRILTNCNERIEIARKILLIEAPWNVNELSVKSNQRINLPNVDLVLETLLKNSQIDLTDANGNTYLHLLVMHSVVNQVNFIEWAKKVPSLTDQWKAMNHNDETPFLLLCKLLNGTSALYGHRVDLLSIVSHFQLDYVTANNRGETPIGYLVMCKTFSSTLAPSWLELPGVDLTVPEHTRDVWEKLWDNNLLTKQIVDHIINVNPTMLIKLGALRKKTLLMLVLERIIDESGTGSTEDISGTLGSQLECTRVFFDSLLQYKDHLNVQDLNGNTALHTACQYFHLGAVDAVKSGVKNFKAFTFMKIACALLDAGADPSIKNNLGLTPIDYAPHVMEFYNQYIQNWIVTAIMS